MIHISTKFQDSNNKIVEGICNTKLPVFCTQTNRHTHGQTDRLILVYSQKHSFCWGVTITICSQNPLYWAIFFFNSLPNGKILDVTKLKAFVEDKINIAQITISVFDRVENIVGKGESAAYQHFLLFPQCFQKASFLGSLKVGIV